MAAAYIQSFRVVQGICSIPSHIHSFGAQAGNCFADHIITARWREMLSVGVVLAVISAVAAFFYSTLLGASFLVFGALHAINTLRLHHFAVLQDIERTARDLERRVAELSSEGQTLREEMQRLIVLNENLMSLNRNLEAHVALAQKETENHKQANAQSRQNIARLELANTGLTQTNHSLENQVQTLAEQGINFKESAEWISKEINRLGVQNKAFDQHNQRLQAAGLLYEKLLKELDSYKAGVREFFKETFEQNFFAQDAFVRKMTDLDLVQQKLDKATDKLHATELLSTDSTARLEENVKHLKEVREGLNLLVAQFKETLQGFDSSNSTHAEEILKLQEIVTRLALFTEQDPTDPACILNGPPTQWSPFKKRMDRCPSTVRRNLEEALK